MSKNIKNLLKELNFFEKQAKDLEELKEDTTYNARLEQLRHQVETHDNLLSEIYTEEGKLKKEVRPELIERMNRSHSAINKTEKLLNDKLDKIKKEREAKEAEEAEEEDPLAFILEDEAPIPGNKRKKKNNR